MWKKHKKEENFMMKKIIGLLLTVTMAFGLVACSGETAPETTESSAAVEQETTEAEETTEVVGKDVLRVGYAYEQFTSPWRMSSASPLALANIYDTLYAYDKDMNAVPQLAESCEISEDGTVYTFKLREGVKFHNGEEMTAEDVAWSLTFSFEEGDSGKALLGNFDHTEVVDDYTVEVHLTAPFGPFLKGLCSRAGFIADKSHFEKVGGTIEAYEADPVGCGQYKLADRVVGTSTTLETFEDYWNGVAPIKTIELKMISDSNAQVVALEAGEIDALINPALNSLVLLNNENVDWTYGESNSRVAANFNVADNRVTSDVNLRKAIQSVVNRQDIILAANEGYGIVGDICFNPNYSARPTDFDVVAEDVEKAKEYLDASSYNGEKIAVIAVSGTAQERVAGILQAQCYEIGVDLEIKAVDSPTYEELKASGEFDIIMAGWGSSLVDCDVSYAVFGPASNMKFYKYEEQLHNDCVTGRTSTAEADRVAAYSDLAKLVTEEALEITFYYDVVTVAYNKVLNTPDIQAINMYDFGTWSWAK